LEGFDVVVLWAGNSPDPEHSPLSCNLLAEELPTNTYCLFQTLEQAQDALNNGKFAKGEQGTFRIFAAYIVDWPESPAQSRIPSDSSADQH